LVKTTESYHRFFGVAFFVVFLVVFATAFLATVFFGIPFVFFFVVTFFAAAFNVGGEVNSRYGIFFIMSALNEFLFGAAGVN